MIEVNWSPFATNPIDYIEGRSSRKLTTPTGEEVKIIQSGISFVVEINGERTVTTNNANTCYFLNQHQVGFAA